MKALILAAIRCSLMFTAVTASLFSVRPAQANYIVKLKQVGPNVVATGSGAFDLTGLPVKARGSSQPLIQPFLGNIVTGSSNDCDVYGTTITGPSNFGIGIEAGLVSIWTGDLVGMAFNGGNSSFLLVPVGYVSGTALTSSATYDNLTLGSPDVMPGTYVWTWGMERTKASRSRSGRWVSRVSPMAARQFLCSVSVCSARPPCGASWLARPRTGFANGQS